VLGDFCKSLNFKMGNKKGTDVSICSLGDL
jgi:hypothetical protein